MRVMAAAIAVLCVFVPCVATGQTATGADHFSLQLAGGPTLKGGGNVLSAAFGYAPVSRLELLLNVERTHLPFEIRRYADGYGITRGGTMTFASGELRLALLPTDRVSPFVVVGAGGGVSRPTVNAEFPNAVTNRLRVLYFGGGVRVPLPRGFSVWGDVRPMLALEHYDTVMAVWPVRAGVTWRF
jgi:hypothetical protein